MKAVYSEAFVLCNAHGPLGARLTGWGPGLSGYPKGDSMNSFGMDLTQNKPQKAVSSAAKAIPNLCG